MIIILFFGIASLLASAFVVSACVLSSRISQRENVAETYEVDEPVPFHVAPRSSS